MGTKSIAIKHILNIQAHVKLVLNSKFNRQEYMRALSERLC